MSGAEPGDDLAGKTLYAVTYRRESYCTTYVFASSEAEARDDADEMIGVEDKWDIEDEVIESVDEVAAIPEHRTAWSGGPDGRDVEPWEVPS